MEFQEYINNRLNKLWKKLQEESNYSSLICIPSTSASVAITTFLYLNPSSHLQYLKQLEAD